MVPATWSEHHRTRVSLLLKNTSQREITEDSRSVPITRIAGRLAHFPPRMRDSQPTSRTNCTKWAFSVSLIAKEKRARTATAFAVAMRARSLLLDFTCLQATGSAWNAFQFCSKAVLA